VQVQVQVQISPVAEVLGMSFGLAFCCIRQSEASAVHTDRDGSSVIIMSMRAAGDPRAHDTTR